MSLLVGILILALVLGGVLILMILTLAEDDWWAIGVICLIGGVIAALVALLYTGICLVDGDWHL